MAEWCRYVRRDHGVDREGLMLMDQWARVAEEHRTGCEPGISDKTAGEPVRVTVRIGDGRGSLLYTTDPETAERLIDGEVMVALLLEDEDG